jgi:hypothetical protein
VCSEYSRSISCPLITATADLTSIGQQENRDQFGAALPTLSAHLDTYLRWRNDMVTASSELKEVQHSREQLAMFLSASAARENGVSSRLTRVSSSCVS